MKKVASRQSVRGEPERRGRLLRSPAAALRSRAESSWGPVVSDWRTPMKALSGMAPRTSVAIPCPIPRSSIRATPSSRSRAPRSAAPTCISTTASCPAWSPATSWATSPWARSSRSDREPRASSRSATGSWSRSRSLRRVRAVRAATTPSASVQPQQGRGRQGVRPRDRRPVRLQPPHRRLCRAARPSMCASRLRTAPSRFRTG